MLLGPRERKTGPDGGRSLRGPWHKWLIRKCFPAHRLKRLRASPHEVALGCAVGVFVSITPLLGAQMLIAALLAGLLRASAPAAVLGTFFGNPVSWPFIWASTYAVGLQMIRLDGVLDAGNFEQNIMLLWTALLERSPELLNATAALLWPLLLPMLAGSLPLGLLTAAIFYYISRNLIRRWQAHRLTHVPATAD
ncbi:MAG: DUF2062 domain-containing protein [Hyphomicrobiaceae bacterium]